MYNLLAYPTRYYRSNTERGYLQNLSMFIGDFMFFFACNVAKIETCLANIPENENEKST